MVSTSSRSIGSPSPRSRSTSAHGQRQRGGRGQRGPGRPVELDERGHAVPVEHRGRRRRPISSATDATGTSLSPAMRRNSAGHWTPVSTNRRRALRICDLRLTDAHVAVHSVISGLAQLPTMGGMATPQVRIPYHSPLLQLPGAVDATGIDAGTAWHYGDPIGEQRAAESGAVLFDRSNRSIADRDRHRSADLAAHADQPVPRPRWPTARSPRRCAVTAGPRRAPVRRSPSSAGPPTWTPNPAPVPGCSATWTACGSGRRSRSPTPATESRPADAGRAEGGRPSLRRR